MLQYTNGFSCAMDQEEEEIIINFVQQSPVLDDEGKVKEVKSEEVISLVMRKALVEKLLETLCEMTGSDDTQISKGRNSI